MRAARDSEYGRTEGSRPLAGAWRGRGATRAGLRRGLGGAIAALAAFSVLLGLVSVAHAAFSAPINLAATVWAYGYPQITTDADGDAVAAWLRWDGSNLRVQARTISAAGVLGPSRTLSGAGQDASDVQIASDAQGGAIAVWMRPDGFRNRIQARTISAAGTLGPVQTLSAAGQAASEPQIATDADGDAVAVWTLYDGSNLRVQVRTISAAGLLGPVRTLSPGGDDPQIAIDADGDAVAVWTVQEVIDDLTTWRVESRRIPAVGALEPLRTLSPPGPFTTDARIASDADGDAVALWQRGSDDAHVQARTISAGGILGPVRTLSASQQGVLDPFEAQIASDADGGAVAIWRRSDGAYNRIEARTISAAGVLGPTRTVKFGVKPQIASDADGDAVAIWRKPEGSGIYRIQARTIPAAGAFGPLQTLSAAGRNADVPQIATDADGDAVAVWSLSTGGLQASQGP